MTDLTTRDAMFLRRAIALATTAAANGQRPFGAVVADAEGHVVAEACSTQQVDRDWTAHAELNAIRAAGRELSWTALAGATLYASGDPCPMCSGAMVWSNIRRLVYGVDEATMRPLRGAHLQGRGLTMSCREVLARAPEEIDVIGPALVNEAVAPHRAYWDAAKKEEGWV